MQVEDKLEQRRRELIARCAEQRKRVGLQVSEWRHSLSPEELTHSALYAVKRYQPWIIGSALAVLILKPRRIANAVKHATAAAATFRTMAPLIETVQHKIWQARHPGRMQL